MSKYNTHLYLLKRKEDKGKGDLIIFRLPRMARGEEPRAKEEEGGGIGVSLSSYSTWVPLLLSPFPLFVPNP